MSTSKRSALALHQSAVEDEHPHHVALDAAPAAKRLKSGDDETVPPEVTTAHAPEDAVAAAAAAAHLADHHHHHHHPPHHPEAAAAAAPRAANPTVPARSSAATSLRSSTVKRAPTFTSENIRVNPTDPANFDTYFFALCHFKAQFNNFQVPKDSHPNLYAWLQWLKREYKQYLCHAASQLTPAQRQVLEYWHVPLTSRGDDHWNRFFQLLQAYKERHGHVLVPRVCEVPGLGDWVTDQRRQYKAWKQGGNSQLSQERRDKLESLGFAWQVRFRPEWEQRFAELLVYKQTYGDCKVPQHFKSNKALGKWVAKQREQYKLKRKGQHSFLTDYRLEKLNSVGFVWQVRSGLPEEDEDEADTAILGDGDHQQQSQAAAAAAAVAVAQAQAHAAVAAVAAAVATPVVPKEDPTKATMAAVEHTDAAGTNNPTLLTHSI